MLQLTIIRKTNKPDRTIGQLFANGRQICDTIEDTDRGLHQGMSAMEIKRKKVANQTAIPIGSYRLTVTPSTTYGRNLIEVKDVLGFSGVKVHAKDIPACRHGCIVPCQINDDGEITNSTHFEELLTSMVSAARASGEEDIFLTIISD